MHSSKVVGARGSTGLGAAYPAPISVPGVTGAAKGPAGYSSTTGAGYDAGKYYSSQSSSYYSQPVTKPSAIPSYWSQPSAATSSYSSYLSTGAAASSVPAYTSSYGSFLPSTGTSSRGRGAGSSFRGGSGFRGRGGINKPRANVIKPKPPPPMTPEQKQHAENHNIKQLVAPKPPFVILNEMVGGGVQYEYTENPPIPDFVGYLPQLHTLMTEIDGDISTGTGPRYEIAKNICAEHAIQGVVSRRYEGLKKLVESGTKTREELLLEDETPFELASIAIFKMMNDWQADGYEIPEPIQDVIYSRQGFIPAKQRLGWIRGSNMGFNAYQLDPQGRRKPITMPGNTEGKNPVAFLNEIRGNVEYVLLGMYGNCEENYSFTIGCNIDGVPYSGSGKTKKDAKKNCAMDVLSRLYRITV